jgi:Ca2+-binding RTX toxin-like protein
MFGGFVGGEFRVNDTTLAAQEVPSVTGLADGGFLVAWESNGQDGSGYGVYARRYDGAGTPVGGEFLLAEISAGDQRSVVVSARPDGGFVASWTSSDNSSEGIVTRVFPGRLQTVGGDWLFGSSANDVLTGGAGADTYEFGAESGNDDIDNRGRNNDGDRLLFSGEIASNQLWFQRAGDDLNILVVESGNSATILDWYVDPSNHLAQFETSSGRILIAADVDNLVNAMAAFSPPPIGATSINFDETPDLMAVIAANWK